jgi:hypothetical protein
MTGSVEVRGHGLVIARLWGAVLLVEIEVATCARDRRDRLRRRSQKVGTFRAARFCATAPGVRRAVLDALGFIYKRSFMDQWEFVEYVLANKVHDHTTGKLLDLLTPPKRPQQP